MSSSVDTIELCKNAQKHLKNKNISEAIDLFEQVIESESHNVDAFRGLAVAYFTGKDYRTAAEYFRKVISLDPLDGKALINLGAVLNLLNEYQESIKVLQKGSLREKNSPEAFYNLGLAYKGLNQSSMAISAYKEAVRLDPDMYEALYNLANIYLDMKNYQQAIAYYKKSLEIKPEFDRAQRGLTQAEESSLESKSSISPFGRLVDASIQKAHAVKNVNLELTAQQRHEDRMKVKELSKQSEVLAKELLSFLKQDFEPSLLKLNRSVAEVSAAPWELTESEAKFRSVVERFHELRKKLRRKTLELRAHEEFINTPNLNLPK